MKANLRTTITLAGLGTLLALTTACSDAGKVDQSEADTNLVLGLLVGQEQGKNLEAGKDFILNGTWNSFTGNATSSTTITTIKAKSGKDGIKLDDDTGYSSCSIIKTFDNKAGFWIGQNPENNGACFDGDGFKGKFFKTVFFKNTEKENSYWFCTIFEPKNTANEALNVTDNTNRSNPGTTGCGGFSWSRLERR
jgi:hypothetical protein